MDYLQNQNRLDGTNLPYGRKIPFELAFLLSSQEPLDRNLSLEFQSFSRISTEIDLNDLAAASLSGNNTKRFVAANNVRCVEDESSSNYNRSTDLSRRKATMNSSHAAREELDRLFSFDAAFSLLFGSLALLAPHGVLQTLSGGFYNHSVHETLR